LKNGKELFKVSTKTIELAERIAAGTSRQPKKPARKAASSWSAIYKFVRRIPRGSVITYGGVAKKIRLRAGARVVGYAMAGCPSGSGIPWHRVIGAGGHLRLSEPLVSLQRKLLESEGVTFIERRVDIERHLWTAQKRAKTAKGKRMKKRP
jgi:methylated-DNA-protein-cysteine methyltransferase related protein